MNPVPFVITGVVVAVVPPLRRRAVAVTGAAVGGVANVAISVIGGAFGVAEATVIGVSDIAVAAVRGPEGDGGKPRRASEGSK